MFRTLLLFTLLLPDWGFFAHRRITQVAVFTLPIELVAFYKPHLDYLKEQSVVPDKRRHTIKSEQFNHYIDLELYQKDSTGQYPKYWSSAIIQQIALIKINGQDTLWANKTTTYDSIFFELKDEIYASHQDSFYQWFQNQPTQKFIPLFEGNHKVGVVDTFTQHGILPYHLKRMYASLVRAFEEQNTFKILKRSAEISHYIADACVPLHTTRNYNGQLTNQIGIHAFWETRIPTLFADKHYNFFVRKAAYIAEPATYFWNLVLDSHDLVDEVLTVEQEVRYQTPEKRQWCYEQSGRNTIRVPCVAFSNAYQKALNGMVEERMRAAICAIGDVWFSAWIDAGQPSLNTQDEKMLVSDILPSRVQNDTTWVKRSHE